MNTTTISEALRAIEDALWRFGVQATYFETGDFWSYDKGVPGRMVAYVSDGTMKIEVSGDLAKLIRAHWELVRPA